MSSQPKHMTKVVNDLTWHWVEQGEGPAVVLLHGIPESWRCWEKQMPVLSQQFRVLALDLKGYGQSDKAEGDSISCPSAWSVMSGAVSRFITMTRETPCTISGTV